MDLHYLAVEGDLFMMEISDFDGICNVFFIFKGQKFAGISVFANAACK